MPAGYNAAKVWRGGAVTAIENLRKDAIVKVDTSLKPLGTGNVSGTRQKVDAGKARGGDGAAEVKLSSVSTQLSAAGSSGAPIDGARIAEIKQAISEGRFQINADAIADGLINTARDLLQSQRKT